MTREKLKEIIFEADTPSGKRFDVWLLVAIIVSVLVVLLDSVPDLNQRYGSLFYIIEWVVTILFTIEYFIRIYISDKRLKYLTSFFGIIDLLSILPTFLGLFIVGSHSLIAIRILRLLRIFRVLKLIAFMNESDVLLNALYRSKQKIFVFIYAVMILTVIVGTLMYIIEGADSGFTSIPRSIYWSIVTLTTVGYGDIAPQTVLGQTLASVIMILGYGIIAVPTGIVGTELRKAAVSKSKKVCPYCKFDGIDIDDVFCRKCGYQLSKTAEK
jgi:voltage-gated potassium channel